MFNVIIMLSLKSAFLLFCSACCVFVSFPHLPMGPSAPLLFLQFYWLIGVCLCIGLSVVTLDITLYIHVTSQNLLRSTFTSLSVTWKLFTLQHLYTVALFPLN